MSSSIYNGTDLKQEKKNRTYIREQYIILLSNGDQRTHIFIILFYIVIHFYILAPVYKDINGFDYFKQKLNDSKSSC